MCVLQNWTNPEKRSLFPQFSSKLSKIFVGERYSTDLESIIFWIECDVWKMDDLFQCPLGPISVILNFSHGNLTYYFCIFLNKLNKSQIADAHLIMCYFWKLSRPSLVFVWEKNPKNFSFSSCYTIALRLYNYIYFSFFAWRSN